GHADLFRMIGVVEPDADHLADARERAAEPLSPAHRRQAGALHAAQALEAGWRQDVGGDVLHDPREIAQDAVGSDESGFLLIRAAIADELHWRGSLSWRCRDEIDANGPISPGARSRLAGGGGWRERTLAQIGCQRRVARWRSRPRQVQFSRSAMPH